MENLYIQINNGQPVNHPTTEENLLQAFGAVPSDWSPFKRVLQPDNLEKSVYKKIECVYALGSDGVTWEDTWVVSDRTPEEQTAFIDELNANRPYPNAVLNPNNLTWDIPPRPKEKLNEGTCYLFNLKQGLWIVAPLHPKDEKNYRFDFETMNWIEETPNV